MKSYTSLLMLLVWMSSVGSIASQACDPGWFGPPSCEYKCRCFDNKCNSDGACAGQVGCSSGWFGPLCQYVNLASKDYLSTNSEVPAVVALFDGNDDTCIQDPHHDTVTVTLNLLYPFTWMRIVLKPSVSMLPDSFQVTFQTANSQYFDCVSKRHSVIDTRTLDLRCDLNVPVQQVILTGEGVKSLCSLYISGGRNVALKQNATQSTTYLPWVASNAVDGVANIESGAHCTSTYSNNTISQSLTLTLSRPQLVNRYVLYNRNNFMERRRLSGFTITSFAENGSQVFYYKDQSNAQYEAKYTVISFLPTWPFVSMVRVNARDPTPTTGAPTLSLCELEIYAECSVKSFGPDCSGTCSNDCLDQMCHHANGHCYDCAAGKRGVNCNQECPHLTYGQDCKENCSVNCANDGSCNKQNGNCSHGCKPGYKGLICDEQCSSKVYGADCLQKCSKDCLNEECNDITGHCDECIPGRLGDFCEQDCQAGSYGQGCTQTCSKKCNDTCDPRDGSCAKGCKHGYLGTQCDEPCPFNKFGQDCLKNCSINCMRSESFQSSVCQFETGTCLLGCEEGFTGLDCSLILNVSEPNFWIGMGVGIVVAVFLAIIVIISIYFYRRRTKPLSPGEQRSTRKTSTTDDGYEVPRNQTSRATIQHGNENTTNEAPGHYEEVMKDEVRQDPLASNPQEHYARPEGYELVDFTRLEDRPYNALYTSGDGYNFPRNAGLSATDGKSSDNETTQYENADANHYEQIVEDVAPEPCISIPQVRHATREDKDSHAEYVNSEKK